MLVRLHRRAAAWLAIGVIACAPEADETAETRVSDTGSTGVVCGEPQVGVDPFAGAPSCEVLFALPESPPAVTVTIVNGTDRGIIISNRTIGCHQPTRYFDVTGQIGSHQVVAPTSYCPSDWNACATRDPAYEACKLCLTIGWPIYIAPGGHYVQTWEAWVFTDVTLPAQCVGGDEDIPCAAATPIVAGSYTVFASAAHPEPFTCTCEVDAQGSCPLEEERDCGWKDQVLMATAQYDGVCGAVELVFSD